jgi:CelD/BcsL family acetyltransferase involved in cellulose biosynthesis
MKDSAESVDARLLCARDHVHLETDWRALEAVAGTSPFTSWPWISAWLATLPAAIEPLLFRAADERGLLALALLVEARPPGVAGLLSGSLLHMQETGDTALDELTVEYGGLMVRRGDEALGYAALLRALAGSRLRGRELRIPASAHGAFVQAGLRANWQARSRRRAPDFFIDLDQLRAKGYLESLSSSTRYDVRRSVRAYEAHGEVRLDFATDVDQALQWFAELEVLHQRHWQEKGQGGAFQSAYFGSFHRELIRSSPPGGLPRLARLRAGEAIVGYYYHLVYGKNVFCYNGGLDYAVPSKHHRPGYLMHLKAIEHAMAGGYATYDFLAGDSLYKKTLSTHQTSLDWIAITPLNVLNRLRQALADRLGGGRRREALAVTTSAPDALR